MSADPLSDALAIVHARYVVSGGFTAGGRWALRFHQQHRMTLHTVQGNCWLILDDQQPRRLDKGDIAISNGTTPFTLASDPTQPPRNADDAFTTTPTPVAHGETNLTGITGHIQMNPNHEDAILAALPPIAHLTATNPATTALQYLLDRVLRELPHPEPGSEFASEKYAQLILVEVLRIALDTPDTPPTSWLRLLTNTQLRPMRRRGEGHSAHSSEAGNVNGSMVVWLQPNS